MFQVPQLWWKLITSIYYMQVVYDSYQFSIYIYIYIDENVGNIKVELSFLTFFIPILLMGRNFIKIKLYMLLRLAKSALKCRDKW